MDAVSVELEELVVPVEDVVLEDVVLEEVVVSLAAVDDELDSLVVAGASADVVVDCSALVVDWLVDVVAELHRRTGAVGLRR